MNRTFHLHLVSDSTGETTHNLARACLVQFENLEVITLEYSQIQNKARTDRAFAAIQERPVQIRRNRMLKLNEDKKTDYIDIERVRSEVLDARKLFAKMRWPVIDVSRKSIEESVSEIMENFSAHNETRASKSSKSPANENA